MDAPRPSQPQPAPTDSETSESGPARRSGAGNPSKKGNSLVGKVIHDRFRILAPIARGGMGAVYKAEQAPLGRQVAIKILSPRHDEDKDPEFRKRFFLEAATVAKLSHPNTVTVFDYGQSDGLFFIVMELIEGMTLKRAIKEGAPFPVARAVHVGKQICRSLREAHRQGVIHRDMKPGNVMLLTQGDEPDYVKVLDFGLVKDIDKTDDDTDLTQAGVFMGSPKYMSPEQIQGDAIDTRSDIYSVGVLLYEMLTGRAPFVREKQVQVLMDHIHTAPPAMQAEGVQVPAAVQGIVLQCLAKRPEDRFASMEELLIALKRLAGDLSLSIPPSGEMGMTGNYAAISGVHSVSNSQVSMGGIAAPHHPSSHPPLSSASGSIPGMTQPPTGFSHPSLAPGSVPSMASNAMSQPGPTGSAGKLAMAFGAVALAAAVLIVLLALDPFAEAPNAAATPPEVGALEVPEPAPDAVTAVEAPAAEPAPAPRSVLVELTSTPAGATVTIGDTQYGPTPAQVELTGEGAAAGRELTLVFTRPGYRPSTVSRVVPDEGGLEVDARLRVRRRTGRRATPTAPARDVTPEGYRESPY
ncbi:MAG: serine/threonine protein kinase [Sandaracinaceae bacterium]